jgi:hypothetical protein
VLVNDAFEVRLSEHLRPACHVHGTVDARPRCSGRPVSALVSVAPTQRIGA